MQSSIFLGSDCTGSDKSFNRELTVTKGVGLVTVDRRALHPEIDYTVDDLKITFLIRINNLHKIVVFALEKLSQRIPPSLFVEVRKKITIHASVLFEFDRQIRLSSNVLKDIDLRLELNSQIDKRIKIDSHINANIGKEIVKIITITTKLDHSNLIEILEGI